MAKALKLMTWNVQQLAIGAPDGDERNRARAVAAEILALSPRDQPDVIVFNEVFDEDGRKALLRALKNSYPHFIKKLEHPGIDFEEDSGLMLFSKFPFLPLPTGGTHYFEAFPVSAPVDPIKKNFDALAAKGVGIVRVAGPFDPTTIAFTHTQASYDPANTEHMGIRAAQLSFIRKSLLKVADGNFQHYANSVIAGDLNIKGDPDDISGEPALVFSGAPKTFGGDFDDGWRFGMHGPPPDLTQYDPGYTQRDTATYAPNRLDYQCMRRDANVDIGLVAHHMSTPIRLASEITDHWSLMGHLHRIAPHCTPSSAVKLLDAAPLNQTGSLLWALQTNFRDEDMYHWVYIGEPGTFSVWAVAPVVIEFAAYRQSDFTHELEPADFLTVNQLPPPLQTLMTGGPEVQQLLFGPGSVFSSREPFFIRVRGISETFSGKAGFRIIRHKGESIATAILLEPHKTVNPDLPLGQKLNAADKCYFKARRPDRYTLAPYADPFVLDNPDEVGVTLELCDQFEAPLEPPVSGNSSMLQIVRNKGAEEVYLVLKRTNVNNVRFTITWNSPLTYLWLDESFRLHVDDETGPDWPGADELELRLEVDGDSAYVGGWDDADSDEDWPGLVQSIRTAVLKRQTQARWLAFTNEISFDAIKTDGLFAHGSAVGFIKALGAGSPDKQNPSAGINISDPVGDGHLTAHVTIAKYP